jgi:hypothetical protein
MRRIISHSNGHKDFHNQEDNDPFRPREDNEKFLEPERPYLRAIGTLMYLANGSRADIAFVVNLLARFSSIPTKKN